MLPCARSLRIKQLDAMDTLLTQKFTRFLMQRSEQFIIMRRKPVEVRSERVCTSARAPSPVCSPAKGYSISFLITHTHLENRTIEYHDRRAHQRTPDYPLARGSFTQVT